MIRRIDRMRRTTLACWMVFAFGCSAGDDAAGDSQRASCDTVWRTSTPGFVACPGAQDCRCEAPEVCCVPSKPSPKDIGSCGPVSGCAQLAFACDGPEDCATDQVCCVRGMGSTCTTEFDCFGSESYVLCHEDGECKSRVGTACGPADPDTFWDTLMGVCR